MVRDMAPSHRASMGAVGGIMTRNTTPLTGDGIMGMQGIAGMGGMVCTRAVNSPRV